VVKKIAIDGYGVVLERILLLIVILNFYKKQEAKASEVPMAIGTENERRDNLISICFLSL
jgi:hypothetical protein